MHIIIYSTHVLNLRRTKSLQTSDMIHERQLKFVPFHETKAYALAPTHE